MPRPVHTTKSKLPQATPATPRPIMAVTAETPLDLLPPGMQGLHAKRQFERVATADEFVAASERWAQVRPRLLAYETKMQCEESGAASDKAVAMNIVEDLVNAPVDLMLSLAQLILAIVGREKDDASKALGEAFDKALEEFWDKGKEKAVDRAGKALRPATARLREELIRYLQTKSRRSRRHFEKVMDAAGATLRGVGSVTARIAGIVFDSTRITPEWCGILRDVDGAQRAAFDRVFPAPKAPAPGPKLPPRG